MELFLRTMYHKALMFLFKVSGLQNFDAFNYNIKRIDNILKNDYRDFACEELSAESEGSCSVVSGDVSTGEDIPRTDDFELPEGSEKDESEHDSGEQSDECENQEE